MDTTENAVCNFPWFIVQSRTNYEKQVVKNLRDRIAMAGLESQFGEIMVPAEEIIEMKNGQKRKSERKFFPGYVLIQIAVGENGFMSNEAWHIVRETTNVTGFIGGTADRPRPITDEEASRILNRLVKKDGKLVPNVIVSEFNKGDTLRVKSGPFVDFNGVVESADANRGKVTLSLMVFGRATSVELESSQVERTL